MTVSTTVRLRFAAALLALGAVACSDSPTTARARENAPKLVAPSLAAYYAFGVSFTLDPRVPQTLKFGPHTVKFPAYSICDPVTSGYGEGTWDNECSPLQQPIVITATFTLNDGHALIDFQPSIRFVPSEDPAQWVTLTMSEPYELNTDEPYSILWQRPADGSWVDEGAQDPTMNASTNLGSNSVTRRIKHFSGYNVTAGFLSDLPLDAPTDTWFSIF